MEGKKYKNQLVGLVLITIIFLSSCKTIETVHTEYVKDSTVELFLKEQLEIKELQLSEINKELKETYKEVTKLKAETNTSIEKYDTAQNVTERIIINRVESADNSKEYNSELFETLHSKIAYLIEQNVQLSEQIDSYEEGKSKSKEKGDVWGRLTNVLLLIGVVALVVAGLGAIFYFAVRLIIKFAYKF